jgi:hypothetical protein
MQHLFKVFFLVACIVAATSPARAEPLIFVPSDALANDTLTSILANEVLEDATAGSGKPRRGAKSAQAARKAVPAGATVITLGAPRMAAKLAEHYPPGQRSEVRRTYSTLLDKYRNEMEPKLGIPRNDLAGAVAAFLAGNYMAYNNTDFPDRHFAPLMTQMRQTIGSNPDFAKSSNADKQDMYEQMAILGMFMAGTQLALRQKPDAQVAANLKQAAKGYLEQFLKIDAERVQITAQGLVLK